MVMVGDVASPPGRTLRVVGVDPQADPRWAAFVAGHPEGTIYHHPAWLRALAAEYGQRALHLACEDDAGQFRGILPLLHTRGLPFGRGGLLTGRRLTSLPRTPLAGPLAVDAQAAAALLREAAARVEREPGLRLQVKVAAPTLEGLAPGVIGLPWRLSYALELPAEPAALRFGNARNHAAIKRAVQKAARSGVVVRAAEAEADLRAWYALYLETMRWHAVPARPYRFFRALWAELRPAGLLRLLLAEGPMGGPPLAGLLLLAFGPTVSYAFGGRRADALDLRPNEALHWRAIHDARREGYRRYDFGEVTDGHAGLAEFKRKWGTTPQRLYRYYYPAPPGLAPEAGQDERPLRRWANAAWRRLPLPLTALVGDRLYSYM